jgi:hypothetical protein
MRTVRQLLPRSLVTSAILMASLAVFFAPSSKAAILVSSTSAVGFVFTYQIEEQPTGRISGTGSVPGASTPLSSSGSLVDDYFTIYDFAGFTGTHVDPAGWSFESLLVGATDTSIDARDSPTIANLTWYKTGGDLGAGPFVVLGFSATSFFASQVMGQWSSEDTGNGPLVPDGSSEATVGGVFPPLVVPRDPATDLPEPTSLLLLGSGLISLSPSFRRRFHLFQRK